MMNSGPVRDGAAQAASAASDAPLLKLEDFLPHRLNVLSSLVSQALTRVYGRYGIGIPEWRVFVSPGDNGAVSRKAGGGPTPHDHNTTSPPGGAAPPPPLLRPPAPPPC